jgi:hypothetical protein
MKKLIAVAIATSALVASASAQTTGIDADTWWKRGEGADARLTMVNLVKRGYEIKATQPYKGALAWVYLQKGASVFRCIDNMEPVAGNPLLGSKWLATCLELVEPFKSGK